MGNDADPEIPNAEQIEAWNGAMGAKWVENQTRLDRMIEPFGKALLKAAAIKPGEKVLDVGCGCGATTLEAATLAGDNGRVLGIDISMPMVDRAKARATESGSTASFAVADASMHTFGTDTFDLMISRFGIMFFDEPAAAFANLRQALTRKGRIAFVCWKGPFENPWLSVPVMAALAHLPPPDLNPDAPGPFAFADDARLTSILDTAGFRDIRLTPFSATVTLGTSASDPLEEALEQALEIGPVSRMLADQSDATREKVKAAVSAELIKYRTPEGIGLAGSTWIVTAAV